MTLGLYMEGIRQEIRGIFLFLSCAKFIGNVSRMAERASLTFQNIYERNELESINKQNEISNKQKRKQAVDNDQAEGPCLKKNFKQVLLATVNVGCV